MEVISPTDCNNAPKKQILRDFIVACINKDTAYIEEHTTEAFEWNIVSKAVYQGRENFLEAMDERREGEITRIELLNVITHGHTAAVNGNLTYADNRMISFCHVFRFVSAGKNTLKQMTSYIIA